MRRLAALLIVSLALAAPAAAQQGKITVVTPAAEAAELRGRVDGDPSRSATPEAETEDEAPALVLPLEPAVIATPVRDARQCRMTCSRDYYFCLAGEDDLCPQHWSRCVTGCGA